MTHYLTLALALAWVVPVIYAIVPKRKHPRY